MKLLNKIDLEWRILFVVSVLLITSLLSMNYVIKEQFNEGIKCGIDSELESFLVEEYESSDSIEQATIEPILQRYTQWKAVLPLLENQYQTRISAFSFMLMFLFILCSFAVMRYLTSPLKNIAKNVNIISRGGEVSLKKRGVGSVATVENAVDDLQKELKVFRAKAVMEGEKKAWVEIARKMAHEIKNPLTPIRLLIDRIDESIMMDEKIEPEKLTKVTTRINQQLDLLEQLVNEFKSFSNRPSVEVSEFSLHTLLSSLAFDYESMAKISTIGDATIFSDKKLLKQIFGNLIKNSIEADANEISIRVINNENHINVSIRDNGCGVGEDEIDKIFNPYVTTKKEGTGLGLSITKQIVETLNGEISVEAGKGFKVTVTLPKIYKEEMIHGV